MFQDIFLLISLACFFIWTLRSLYKQIVFFQKLPHSFLYPKQNKVTFIASSLFSFSGLLSWLILAVSFLMTITDLSTLYVEALITALFLGKAIFVVREFKNKKLFESYIYPRSVILLVTSLLCILLLSFYPLTIHVIWILLLERATFLIALFLLFLFGFPAELLDDVAVKKASEKMKSLKNSTKIIVLGGDGDEISWMLGEIIKSTKSVDSLPTGMLTRGELARQIIKIKRPAEVIILSINSQNINLFKMALKIFSPDICVIASSSLSQSSEVINIRSFAQDIDKKTKIILPIEYENPARIFLRRNSIFYYSSNKEISLKEGAYIEDILYKKSGIHFSLILSSQSIKIESNSIDTDVIHFIVPVTLVAKIIHIGMKEVQQFVAKAIYPNSMFSLGKSKKKQIYINGLDVTSIEKIVREVEYLKIFGSNIVVVIGKISPLVTKKELLFLGSALNSVSGSVILLHHEYLRPLRAGMKDTKGNSKIACLSLQETQKLLKGSEKYEKVLFLGKDCQPLYRIFSQDE